MKKIFFLLVIFSLISCLEKKQKIESKSELKDSDNNFKKNVFNSKEFVIEYNAPPSPPKEVVVEKKIEDSFKEEISLLKEKLKEIKKVSEKKNESEVEDGGEKSTKITQFVWERKKIEEKEEVKEKNFDYRNQPYYDYENGKINNQKFISIVRDPNNGSITTEFKGRKFYFKNDWEKRQFESIISNLK